MATENCKKNASNQVNTYSHIFYCFVCICIFMNILMNKTKKTKENSIIWKRNQRLCLFDQTPRRPPMPCLSWLDDSHDFCSQTNTWHRSTFTQQLVLNNFTTLKNLYFPLLSSVTLPTPSKTILKQIMNNKLQMTTGRYEMLIVQMAC